MKKLLMVAVVALVTAGIAQAGGAGGWASVQLSSTPKGKQAGQAWVVDVKVLQHGQTPVNGCNPTITIRNGTATKTFPARKLASLGMYRVRVVFPKAGMWRYEVYDGFAKYGRAKTHGYAAVRILA